MGTPQPIPPRVREIIQAVANDYGFTFDDLVGWGRGKRVTHARFMAYAQIRRDIVIMGAPPSLPQIGGWFGGRDHTSILHGLDRVNERHPPRPVRLSLAADMAERAGLW